MVNEKCRAAAKGCGVEPSDCDMMCKHGLTEGTLAAAQTAGLTIKDIWDLFGQFGPKLIPILTTILSLITNKPVTHADE